MAFIPVDNAPRERKTSFTSCIDIKKSSASTRVCNATFDHGRDDFLTTERKAKVREEMDGRWEFHKKAIEDYFPLSALDGFEDEFASFERDNFINGRWKQLPDPNITDETNILLPGFLELMEAIQAHFLPTDNQRGWQDTHDRRMLPRDVWSSTGQKRWLSPDIFIGGTGECFPPPTPYCAPDSKPPDWKWCIVIMDAKTTSGRSKFVDDKLQLGCYAREVFSAQENRRFFPCFIFTQSILQLYVFDRTGAMFSKDLFYHRERKKFCAAMLSMFSLEEVDLGFDTTNYYDGKQQYITTRETVGDRLESVRYIVEECLWHSTALVGDCAISWKARKEGDSDECYLIKDSWVVGGSENEGALLRKACLADGKGLAHVVHYEDVWIHPSADSIRNNRPPGFKLDPKHNRIHTRVVMRISSRAKPLENFSNALELLVALRDAVIGHRGLHSAGILHRDVTPFCILIQPEALNGCRGLLLDLHCAFNMALSPIEELKATTFSRLPVDRLGSMAFQSSYALGSGEESRPHMYLDDLESFFYVLVYMVTCYSEPGPIPVVPRPAFLDTWYAGPPAAGHGKYAEINKENCPYLIQPYFGHAMAELLQKLHTFFRERYREKVQPECSSDYNKFLGYIAETIGILEAQELEYDSATSENEDTVLGGKRPRSSSSTSFDNMPDKLLSKRPRV